MHPRELLKTIYLGDRFCQRIAIDCSERRLEIEVNVISRVRSTSGNWDYYTAEDIVDGVLVFTGLKSVRFEPPGWSQTTRSTALK
jgi:hypothetical protein